MDKHTYTDRINSFVAKGNYHAAVNVALSGLNACRKENDQAGVDAFLKMINDVVQALAEQFGSETYLANN